MEKAPFKAQAKDLRNLRTGAWTLPSYGDTSAAACTAALAKLDVGTDHWLVEIYETDDNPEENGE